MKKIFSIIALVICFTFFVNIAARSVYANENMVENAKSAILISQSGTVLYEKNSETKQPIASIVKLMTLKVIIDEVNRGVLSLEDKVMVSDYAASMGGSQMFLDASSTHLVSELIKGVIVSSANDASVVLAEAVAGSESSFVKIMNEKASALGLINTYFTDSTGLCPDHYSTASDIAKLASNVLTDALYQKFSNIWLENYTHPSGRVTELANTNKLLRTLSGCDAGKTGSTDEAGYCLVITAIRDGMRLYSVVLGEDNSINRFAECKDLINFGFNHFVSKLLYSTSDIVQQVSVSKYHKLVDLYCEQNLEILSRKGEELEYKTEIRMTKSVAPIKAGEVVGEIVVLSDGNEITKVNLITKEDINKSTIFQIADNLITNWKI